MATDYSRQPGDSNVWKGPVGGALPTETAGRLIAGVSRAVDADGNEFLWSTNGWNQTSTNGAAHTSDQALALTQGVEDGSGNIKTTVTDILPVVYRNIQASADYTSVLAAEITEVDLTLANHSSKTVAATAIVVSCAGGANFRGVYVTINKASTSSAATAMTQDAAPNSADVTDHQEVFFVPSGSMALIPYNQTINLVHLLADDVDGSEANTVQVSPL